MLEESTESLEDESISIVDLKQEDYHLTIYDSNMRGLRYSSSEVVSSDSTCAKPLLSEEESSSIDFLKPPDTTSCGGNHDKTKKINLITVNTQDETKQILNPNVENTTQRRWTLILYSITTILLFADQNLLAPNLTQAANEFGFDENERDEKLGGHIALAFFLLGAPASFVVGCAADSDFIPRSILFGITVLIGEGACFITYFTKTYTGLLVTRALTGFSVGGALPLLSSVLGDLYPPEERSAVMASVGIGSGIGISIGQGIAGFLGPKYGWRTPFLVVSIPALCLAILGMATIHDPKRGASDIKSSTSLPLEISSDSDHDNNDSRSIMNHIEENNDTTTFYNPERGDTDNKISNKSFSFEISSDSDHDNSENNIQMNHAKEKDSNMNFCHSLFQICRPSTYQQHIATTKKLVKSKTVLLTLLQGAPGCIPWGIVNTYLNDFLSENCGMTVEQSTFTILIFGLGVLIGQILSGIYGNKLYKIDSRYPLVLSGTMAILGCIPFWILLNTTHIENYIISFGKLLSIYLISILSGVGSGVTGPIVKAVLQNVTLPHERGQAFALLNTFDDFGRGLGPLFVSIMVVNLGGRLIAFNIGVCGWILCGICNYLIYFTLKGDEERIRRWIVTNHSD